MSKESMIDYFFYTGYIFVYLLLLVGIMALSYIFIIKLLKYKRIRGLLRDVIVGQDIRQMSDDDFVKYKQNIDKARNKFKKHERQK